MNDFERLANQIALLVAEDHPIMRPISYPRHHIKTQLDGNHIIMKDASTQSDEIPSETNLSNDFIIINKKDLYFDPRGVAFFLSPNHTTRKKQVTDPKDLKKINRLVRKNIENGIPIDENIFSSENPYSKAFSNLPKNEKK